MALPTQVRILLPPPGRAGAAALRAPSTSSASRSACSVDQNASSPHGRPSGAKAVTSTASGVVRGSPSATASKTMSTTPVVGARIGADEPAEFDLDGQLLPHLAPSGVLDRLSEVGEAAGGWSTAPAAESKPRRRRQIRPSPSRGIAAATGFWLRYARYSRSSGTRSSAGRRPRPRRRSAGGSAPPRAPG